MRFNNLDNWLNFSAQGRTEKLKRMGGDTEWGGGILRKINYFVKYLTTKGITGWGVRDRAPPHFTPMLESQSSGKPCSFRRQQDKGGSSSKTGIIASCTIISIMTKSC